jgi:hypothetical protein
MLRHASYITTAKLLGIRVGRLEIVAQSKNERSQLPLA